MLRRQLAVLATLLTVGVAGAGCGDDDAQATDRGPTGVECEYPTDGRPAAKDVVPPPSDATVSGEVPVTLETSVGTFTATLDADATPCTVNSFVSLADQGYYDATTCHRLTTDGIFVLQCGDPTEDPALQGTGGPGYSFADELSGDETYPAGTLAMANAGADTNGSQFFVVYEETPLPPAYTVFGSVDEATVELVREVAADGTSGLGDGAPNTPVDITSVVAD